MRFGLTVLLLGSCFCAIAQEKVVDGIVFDKTTNGRIAEVNILNTRTGKSAYNNLKAEYQIVANIGDVLIFTKQNYFNDTVKIENYNSLAVYLKPSAIQLQEVKVNSVAINPEEQLAATKRDYTKLYGVLDDRDILSVSPGSGAGISIDALYNMLSREGRNAEKLRKTIQSDYYQNVIDYRFNRALVERITGLKDPQLTEFMQRYRPGYYFVIAASEYDFIASIKSNYRRYLRRPKAYALPALQPAK
ncbi:hypothetical protein [Mucilaginibacter sp.]